MLAVGVGEGDQKPTGVKILVSGGNLGLGSGFALMADGAHRGHGKSLVLECRCPEETKHTFGFRGLGCMAGSMPIICLTQYPGPDGLSPRLLLITGIPFPPLNQVEEEHLILRDPKPQTLNPLDPKTNPKLKTLSIN